MFLSCWLDVLRSHRSYGSHSNSAQTRPQCVPAYTHTNSCALFFLRLRWENLQIAPEGNSARIKR